MGEHLAKVEILKKDIEQLNLESVIMNIAYYMTVQAIDKNGDTDLLIENTGLTSPYRQYSYLIYLLLSRESDGDVEWTEEIKNNIYKRLEEVTYEYALNFFPKDLTELEEWSEEKKNQYQVVMPFFLDYFNTSDLRYEEQIIKKILGLFSRYNNDIKLEYLNTVEELIEIYKEIISILQSQLDNAVQDTHELNKIIVKGIKMLENGSSIDEIQEYSQESLTAFDNSTKDMFKIEIENLEHKFGTERVKGFLNHFSIYIEPRDFTYYTEKNDFLYKPIIYNSDNFYFIIPIYKQLISAIEMGLYDFCNKKYGGKFTRNRDRFAEERVYDSLSKICSHNAKIFTSVFETSDSTNEHDLIVIDGNNCFICEVKARQVREPFRDVNKAYTRIRRDFFSDSGIQHAYQQANKLKKLILSQENTVLYDKTGNTIITIERKNINDIFCLCITDDNFSILASNLTLLLEKEKNEPYPLVTSIDNLELIISGFQFFGLGQKEFIKYIKQRDYYHEKFHSADELGIAGLFLNNNGLDKIKGIEIVDMIFVSNADSDIFDKIYYKELGYDVEVNRAPTNSYELGKMKERTVKKTSTRNRTKSKKKMAQRSKKRNREKK